MTSEVEQKSTTSEYDRNLCEHKLIVEQGSVVERRKVKVGKRLRDRTQAGARRHCHYARSELTKTVGQRPPAQSRCRSLPAPIAEESGGSQSITLLIYHQHNTFYKQHNKMIYCLQYSRLLKPILQLENKATTRKCGNSALHHTKFQEN